MIKWKVVVDDFGNCLSVSEIHWPNPKYFTRTIEPFFGLWKEKK